MPFTEMMEDEKEDEFEEAKELFKDGLRKIFQATQKVSEKVFEGFREGYAKDFTKKRNKVDIARSVVKRLGADLPTPCKAGLRQDTSVSAGRRGNLMGLFHFNDRGRFRAILEPDRLQP